MKRNLDKFDGKERREASCSCRLKYRVQKVLVVFYLLHLKMEETTVFFVNAIISYYSDLCYPPYLISC